jgi:ubiquinol-cytochrome c reductase cytochrome c subunit
MTPTRPIRSQLALPGAITVAVTAALLLVGRSAGRAQSPSPTPSSGGLASSSPLALGSPGRLLYQQDCAWCHGADGGGTANGPSLVGVGAASADFMLRTGRMPISSAEEAPQRTRPMYASDQIAALDGFVASLGAGPAIPTIDPMAGRLGEGQQLYEIHCAACHSSTGTGGALTNGLQAPGLQDSTPTEVAEAVRLGGAGLRSGHMPRFGPEVLDDRQLDSVVRYVQYLRNPQDRGGAGLAHVGPIAEGFVTWVGALLILVVFVRWIGRRST